MRPSPLPERPHINWFVPSTAVRADAAGDTLPAILEAVSRQAHLVVWSRLRPVPMDLQKIADVRQWEGNGWVELNTGDVTIYSVTSDAASDWVREVATHHSGDVLLRSGSWHLTWPPLARQRGVIVATTTSFHQLTTLDCCPVAQIPLDNPEDYAREVIAACRRMMETPAHLPALLSGTVARVLAEGALGRGTERHLATRVSTEIYAWMRGRPDPN